MTTTPLSVACAYENTLESLTGVKEGIEHGVKQVIANHQAARAEEFNAARRARLESGKPGCLN